jgi:hypothetical protein
MHTDDAFLPRQHRKVLGGGEISPHQSSLFGADRTWCYVVMTQRHEQTTPGAATIQTESSNHEQIVVWFQRRVGLADGAVNFCEGHRKN